MSLTRGQEARAWVNFNGTGTVAIQDSFNVSSITDNGTGSYTVNFDQAMPNANYSYIGVTRATAGAYGFLSPQAAWSKTVSALQVGAVTHAGALQDTDDISVVIFGDPS